jgi:hypothetical protein
MILLLIIPLWSLAIGIVIHLLFTSPSNYTFTKNQIKVARERYKRRRANPKNYPNHYIEL